MFVPDSEVKITTEPYGGEEGWYETIVGNFRIPETAALEDLLPTGPGMLCRVFLTFRLCKCNIPSDTYMLLAAGSLAALGGHAVAVGGGKGSHAAAVGGNKASKAKRQEKLVSMVVKQASSSTFHPRKTQPEDYVLVFDTLEGLDILGVTSSASGAGASIGTLVGKKRKV
ncbi:hypothetical protein Hanom_Chr05g00449921 [Helianthus anomalus]